VMKDLQNPSITCYCPMWVWLVSGEDNC
jgi:hypothetical protein